MTDLSDLGEALCSGKTPSGRKIGPTRCVWGVWSGSTWRASSHTRPGKRPTRCSYAPAGRFRPRPKTPRPVRQRPAERLRPFAPRSTPRGRAGTRGATRPGPDAPSPCCPGAGDGDAVAGGRGVPVPGPAGPDPGWYGAGRGWREKPTLAMPNSIPIPIPMSPGEHRPAGGGPLPPGGGGGRGRRPGSGRPLTPRPNPGPHGPRPATGAYHPAPGRPGRPGRADAGAGGGRGDPGRLSTPVSFWPHSPVWI